MILSTSYFLQSNRFIESQVMAIKNSLWLRATLIDSKSYTPAEFLRPILHNLPKRSKETQKAKRSSKASEKGSSNRSILLSQRHQTSFKASPVATYQHSRATNPQMETSCYKRKYPKSSVILHHNNPWRKNPETELPTDKGIKLQHPRSMAKFNPNKTN